MNIKHLRQIAISFSLILSLALVADTMSVGNTYLRITGKISQINKQGDKWTGFAEFEGTAKDGTKYTVQGSVEIVFTDKTQTVIKQISGQLKGKKGSRDYKGFWLATKAIRITGKEIAIPLRDLEGEIRDLEGEATD